MDKRVFAIDEKCFIIFTGKSSADYKSFLRLGNSSFVTEKIQSHVRHIVINDAQFVDYKKEKENIKDMEPGKCSYICNKKNQDILFSGLANLGIDTKSLFHKDLSDEIDNINRIENKKHFFTIFYDNKNVKLVFNEEIIFDLFLALKEKVDYSSERIRLGKLIARLDLLYENHKNESPGNVSPQAKTNDFKNLALFIIQDNNYFPLGLKMFNYSESEKSVIFNCTQRFYVGQNISLTVMEKDSLKLELKGLMVEGEVLESEVLYMYKASFSNVTDADLKIIGEIQANIK